MGNLKKMEVLARAHEIKIAHIDGKRVAAISDDLFRTRTTDIIDCFINKEFIKRFNKEEKLHYK